jgi:hypothetical protein
MPELHRRPRHLTSFMQFRPGDRVTAYCRCGRIAPVSLRTLVKRFDPKIDFDDLAARLVCRGAPAKPGCGRHSPALMCFHDDRVTWLTLGVQDDVPSTNT